MEHNELKKSGENIPVKIKNVVQTDLMKSYGADTREKQAEWIERFAKKFCVFLIEITSYHPEIIKLLQDEKRRKKIEQWLAKHLYDKE
ncbi:MAG: hypothetical protein HYW78_03305 [Parcubacteria group bacterium]|nr:hypothetical protein [Parcubacteria group bacterium]